MISPHAGQLWFRVAFFITAASLVMIFFQTPGTASFVINVISLAVGVIFLIVLVIMIRRSQQ